ncbi:hypothetical protein OBBRIDRAFT_545544 [Obba rivulosa]|uniref:Uncharacterized protein n=1 Tax=Obba rivulosa TaxID=1052685 RepID=A0A8E2DL41_9APHY|nr:hypothetical protein OBBRIDRAFT_545544 [Obba rivulosa]
MSVRSPSVKIPIPYDPLGTRRAPHPSGPSRPQASTCTSSAAPSPSQSRSSSRPPPRPRRSLSVACSPARPLSSPSRGASTPRPGARTSAPCQGPGWRRIDTREHVRRPGRFAGGELCGEGEWAADGAGRLS